MGARRRRLSLPWDNGNKEHFPNRRSGKHVCSIRRRRLIPRPRSNKYSFTDNWLYRDAGTGLGVLPCIIKDREDGPADKCGLPDSKIPWRKSRLFAKRLQAWCATVM